MKTKIFFTSLLISISFCLQAQTYLMNTASNNSNVTTCTGTLYDDGGVAGNYTASAVYVITLTPSTPGTAIQLTFTQWGVDASTVIELFDGPTTSSNTLGLLTSTQSPIGLQIMATAMNPTGQLTLRWTAGSIASPGFAATINCHIPCQPIHAVIDSIGCIPDMVHDYIDVCFPTQITFAALGQYPQNGVVYQQSDATSMFIWDFGDGTADTGQVVTHTYAYASGFDFSVTIFDSMGCGTSNYEAGRVRHPDNPIAQINPVPDMCMGDTVNILTGISGVSTIVVENINGGASGTLQLADTTFLPDGSGVSYMSNLTYTVFPAGMTLSNINDLIGVCLNMEHTYMGDLNIQLICPNGSSVVLLSYAGNTGGGTIIGEPVGMNLPVDDNSSNTTPGIGYDYCFSPTSVSGFIDNAANWTVVSPYIDPIGQVSTSVNQANPGTYQADGVWTNLLGCPLNGTWTIMVTDNLGLDNGYIFSWGLSLNPALIPGGWSYVVPIDSVTWVGPNIYPTSDSSAIIVPDAGGSFLYTATVWDEYGCHYDTSFTVQVVQTPVANLGPDTVVCTTGPIYELYPGPAEHYQWSTMSNADSIPVTSSGIYGVILENYNNTGTLTCSDTDQVYVKVLAQPFVDLGHDTCIKEPMVLDATNLGTFHYIWSNNDTTGSITANATGLYSVTVAEEFGYNCNAIDEINIAFFPVPDLSAGPDSTICRHHTIKIEVTDANGYLNDYPYSYSWSPFPGINPNDPFVTLSWLDPNQTYDIICQVTGCEVYTATMRLTVEPCDLQIPNIFTPNGDGFNDYFKIPNMEYYPNSTMVIYNRWGRKVYENTNYNSEWDGEKCADGVYFWVLTINYGDHGNGLETKQQSGTVTILR
jgi:gliding motility-associated-like protein